MISPKIDKKFIFFLNRNNEIKGLNRGMVATIMAAVVALIRCRANPSPKKYKKGSHKDKRKNNFLSFFSILVSFFISLKIIVRKIVVIKNLRTTKVKRSKPLNAIFIQTKLTDQNSIVIMATGIILKGLFI